MKCCLKRQCAFLDLKRRASYFIAEEVPDTDHVQMDRSFKGENDMQSALYYPFTGPEDDSFLKTALFLWDSVDFIVPYSDFRPYGKSPEADEALEIIGRNYVPTEEDKRNAHEELSDLCQGPLPNKLKFDLEKPERAYSFYPEKLLHETWDMLAESKLAEIVSDGKAVRHVATGPLFGYYMMSILAVCCSQGRKRLVTD